MERTREHGTIETLAQSGNERISAIRRILERKQYEKVDGSMIDLMTAQAIVTVHDALSVENQAKFVGMPAGRMATIAWKLVK